LVGGRAGGGGGGRRPAFMEGLPPRYGGGCGSKRVPANEVMVSEEDSGMRRRSSSPKSSFPIKDDAGYIGYLSDDESDDRDSNVMIRRRRRELLGSDADVSFSNCMLMMITVCGLLMLFLFAVSPWGVPPPRRL
jgi:hypothetical protein